MKKTFKLFLSLLLIAGLATVCGVTTSCSSSQSAPIYSTNHNKSKVIKSQYRVKGNNRSNSATFRSY